MCSRGSGDLLTDSILEELFRSYKVDVTIHSSETNKIIFMLLGVVLQEHPRMK
jgi:hypothetical protein